MLTRPLEQRLVLAGARPRLDPPAAARFRALVTARPDWSRVVGLARPHGVLPLLAQHVTTSGAHLAPPSALEELRTALRRVGRRNLRLMGELAALLRSLAAAGIPAVTYKGPTLAVRVYGNLALRPFRDLDLLVRPMDVAGALAVLERHGYHRTWAPPPGRDTRYLAAGCEYACARADGDIVELHWRIRPRAFGVTLEFDRLWARARAVHVPGGTVRTLALEDLTLVLCVHGTSHAWDRLSWIVDLAELLRPEHGVDWSRVRHDARRLGATRMVHLGVRLAQDLLQADLPQNLRRAADDDRGATVLATEVARVLFTREPGPDPSWARRRFHLRARERATDRLAMLARSALTPNVADWALARLPPALDFLYYVIRPVRLAVKYARALRPSPARPPSLPTQPGATRAR